MVESSMDDFSTNHIINNKLLRTKIQFSCFMYFLTVPFSTASCILMVSFMSF